MRVVAREAIARRLIVHMTTGRGLLVAVARETEFGRSSGQQLNPCDVLSDTHLMAAEAVLLRGRVGVLASRLNLVATDAGSCRDIRIQGSGVLLRRGGTRQEGNDDRQDKPRDRCACVQTRVGLCSDEAVRTVMPISHSICAPTLGCRLPTR